MSNKYNETGSVKETLTGIRYGQKVPNEEDLSEKKIGVNKRKGFTIDNLISEEKVQVNIGKNCSPSPPNFISNSNQFNENLVMSSNLSSASSPPATSSNSPISSSSSSSFKSKSYSSNASNLVQSQALSPCNNFQNSSSSSQNGQVIWNSNQNFLPTQTPNQHQIQSQLGSQIPQIMGHCSSPNSLPFFAHQPGFSQYPSDPQISALHFHLQREQAFNMIRNSNRIFDPRFNLPCKLTQNSKTSFNLFDLLFKSWSGLCCCRGSCCIFHSKRFSQAQKDSHCVYPFSIDEAWKCFWGKSLRGRPREKRPR